MDQSEKLHKERMAALSRAVYATQYAKQDNIPALIEEGLYLGSAGAANNKSHLKSLNVTHILTVTNSLPPAYPNDFTYKIVDVSDGEEVNIAQFFNDCFSFINEGKRMGGVLVHCFVGRSRSVTIVLAYLMKKHGMSLSEAMDLVKSKRSVASPNSGLMLQLQNYEKRLRVTSMCDLIRWPSLDGVTVTTHGLCTSLLERVVDRTTSPVPRGTAIPEAEETTVTQPDRRVVTKAKNAAKRKACTRPEVSTNATKKTKVGQKSSRAGSSWQATSDGVEQADDGDEGSNDYMPYPYDEGSSDDSPPCTKEEWEAVHTVNPGFLNKELFKDPKVQRFLPPAETHPVKALSQEELCGRMSVLQCQLISHVNELKARYNHSRSEVECLSKRCVQQTLTIKQQSHALSEQTKITVRADGEVARLTSALNTLKIKYRNLRAERDVIAADKAEVDEELVKAKSQLELQETELRELKFELSKQESELHSCNDIIADHKRNAEKTRGSMTSFFQSDFETLVRRFLKSDEFNQAFGGVISLALSFGVELGLRMGRSDTQFKELSQRVSNFIPNAQKKFDDAVSAFPTMTFPFFGKVSESAESSLHDLAQLEPDKVIPPLQMCSTAAPPELLKKKP